MNLVQRILKFFPLTFHVLGNLFEFVNVGVGDLNDLGCRLTAAISRTTDLVKRNRISQLMVNIWI